MPAAHRTMILRRDLYPGAAVALDFQQGFYKSRSVLAPRFERLPGVQFSRASAGTARDQAGNVISFVSGAPRITNRGLLLEPSRTNQLFNANAPATQTRTLAAGTYVLHVKGAGSCTASGGAAGVATEGAHLVFTLGASAAVTFTVAGVLSWFQCEQAAAPSSFILTAGAAATRTVDSALLHGLKAIVGAGPLTLFVAADIFNDDALERYLAALSPFAGSTAERFIIERTAPNQLRAASYTGNVQQFSRGPAAYIGARTLKAAASFDGANYLTAVDGAAQGSVAGAYPVGLDTLFLGRSPASATLLLEGYVQRALIYPTAYSQADLNALTA